jgi:hypothetical protein
MKIAATICSRQKDENPELLPARERYTGEHIQKTETIAEESGLPFFILSGKYGLLPGEEEIPNYDYYLANEAIDALLKVVEGQLKKFNISEINFYTEGKESWIPYEFVLNKAANLTGVLLISHRL